MDTHPTHHRVPFVVLACFLFVPTINGLGTKVLEGDVYIQVIGTVHGTLHENDTCTGINRHAVQNIESIRWVLEKLNNNTFLQGLSKGIGLRVSDACGDVTRAETLALQLAAELENGASSDVIGVIGPGARMETEAVSRLLSSLPEQHRLLQMEYTLTSASLSNKNVYKNLFTTVPTVSYQIKTMHSLLRKLRWTYMAIIYEDTEYGRDLKNAFLAETVSRDICFPVDMAVDTAVSIETLADDLHDQFSNATVSVNGAVIFGCHEFADAIVEATELMMKEFSNMDAPVFLFSEGSGFADDVKYASLRGSYVMSPPQNEIPEFGPESKLMTTETELVKFHEPYQSWLRQTSYDGASVYTQYAVQAALTIAKVLKSVCSTAGGCSQLNAKPKQVFIDAMRWIVVDFDRDFHPVRFDTFDTLDLVLSFNHSMDATRPSQSSMYEAYNFQKCETGNNATCIKKVGSETSEQFDFFPGNIRDYTKSDQELTWPDVRKAQCPVDRVCDVCLLQQKQSDLVLFEPGDLYVVGIVPVHNPGNTPLQCGEIKSHGLDIVESIRFTITDPPRSLKNKLPSGKIGVVILDSCNDAQIIQEKILNLHRYGVLQNGQYIPIADKILGYVGGWSSDVSTAVVSITTRLRLVQIAYASTAPRLSNTQLYPYFLRTPTPDSAQADTLLRLVKHFKSNYIQIMYSESAYGEGGRDAVEQLAPEMDVCVANKIGVSRSSTPADKIIDLRKHPEAKVVVCFLGSFEIELFVKSLNDELNRNEFVFISSEGWGTRIDVSSFSNLVGSITLTAELPVNTIFRDHLSKLNPNEDSDNPWLREYMEKYSGCFYDRSMNKKEGDLCSDDYRLDAVSTDYTIDVWSSFVERAVLALLQGAKLTLDKLCSNSTLICQAYRDGPGELFNNVKVSEFRDEGGNTWSRAFDDKGDGLAGYKIYVVNEENKYKLIGSSGITTFTFDDSLYPKSRVINSTCGDQEPCRKCFSYKEPGGGGEEDVPLMWIVLVSVLGLICVILMLWCIYVSRKIGCCIVLDSGRVKMNDTYLTPVHRQVKTTEGFEEYDSIPDRFTVPNNDYITASGMGRDNQTMDPGLDEITAS